MRHQLTRDEYRKLQQDIDEAVMKGTPRYVRTRQSVSMLLSVLDTFLPRDPECRLRVEEHLMEVFFISNSAIINVPPEKDALDKLALERAMLETLAPIIKVG